MLSTYDTDSLQAIINNSDATLLSKAPGVGKKTAERIILELRDKVDKKAVGIQPSIYNIFEADTDEALEVLMSLGFTKIEASRAVESAKAENPASDTSELIKFALGKLSKI